MTGKAGVCNDAQIELKNGATVGNPECTVHDSDQNIDMGGEAGMEVECTCNV